MNGWRRARFRRVRRKIVAIAVGDYGHGHDRSQAKPPPAPLAGCDPVHGFSVGDAAEDVLARCGEPATREVKQLDVSRATRNDDGSVQGDTRSVQVEVWGYNFGAHQFIRLLQFRGGRLVKISTGGYGF